MDSGMVICISWTIQGYPRQRPTDGWTSRCVGSYRMSADEKACQATADPNRNFLAIRNSRSTTKLNGDRSEEGYNR